MSAVVSRASPLSDVGDSSLLNQGANEASASEVQRWLDPARWPTPNWYLSSGDTTPTFETFLLQQLRARYLEMEGDFRSVVGNFPANDRVTAATIFGYLQSARPALESKQPDLLTISTTLDLIDRYMVWLYPAHMIEARMQYTILRLEELQPAGWADYTKMLRRPIRFADEMRAPMDESISACNRVILAQQIGSGLQIKRLQAFRFWGVLMLLVTLLAAPFLFNPTAGRQWPIDQMLSMPTPFKGWVIAGSILVAGMMGGFISGFLQSRSSRVSLADYQETMLKLVLRPVVAGILSLMLAILLSWSLIPAVQVETAGTFFLAAFLAGFSERYFLKLLDLEDPGPLSRTQSSLKPQPIVAEREVPVGESPGQRALPVTAAAPQT